MEDKVIDESTVRTEAQMTLNALFEHIRSEINDRSANVPELVNSATELYRELYR